MILRTTKLNKWSILLQNLKEPSLCPWLALKDLAMEVEICCQ